jgi:hypothetical protein
MKNKIVYAVTIIVTIALAAVCGYIFCTQLTIADGGLPALLGVYLVCLLLSPVIVDIVHEGGHFIVGVIARMGVKMPKIKIFSSSSIQMNPKGDKHMKGRMLLTTVAGNFFTFLLLVLGVISLAVPTVSPVFCMVLPFSFYNFCLNIVPLEYSSGKTDGLVAWEIIKNEPTAQVMIAILKVQGLVNGGTKLEQIDESLIMDLPQLPEDDINFIILTQLRYEYYSARGNDGEAYKYFMRYKDLVQYLPSEYKTEK